MLYTALKHSHILFALLSVLFFNARFWVYFKRARPKVIRVLPHSIDTLFLVTGIALAGMLPAGSSKQWLITKIVLLVGYIFFGIIAMRQNRADNIRYINYLLANLTIVGMLYLAIVKPILF